MEPALDREDLIRILADEIVGAIEDDPVQLVGPAADAIGALVEKARASLLDQVRRELLALADSVDSLAEGAGPSTTSRRHIEAATLREAVEPALKAVAGETPTLSPDLDPRRRGLLREGIVLGFAEGVRHAGGTSRNEPDPYPKDSVVVESVLRTASSFCDIYPGLAGLPEPSAEEAC